jgi:hypothetical protein
LAASATTAKLATKLEPRVPINSDLSAINGLKVQAIHSILCFHLGSILNKAEAAWSLLDLVETHDEVNNLSTLAEELEELALISVEAEVTHIESR